jgi:hypothetical protein
VWFDVSQDAPTVSRSTVRVEPTDCFISYSRANSAEVATTVERVQTRGATAWIDVSGLRPAGEWLAEIFAAIDRARAFVAFLSDAYLDSEVCNDELNRAHDGGKVIVPVLLAGVTEHRIPDWLHALNWIRLGSVEDLDLTVERVLEAVNTDRAWADFHGSLLVRAREWEAGGRPTRLLLRGHDIDVAEVQIDLQRRPGEAQANELQREFVRRSRSHRTRWFGRIVAIAAVVVTGALVLTTIALLQRREAIASQHRAERALAESEYSRLQSEATTAGDKITAVEASLASVRYARIAGKPETETMNRLSEHMAAPLPLAVFEVATEDQHQYGDHLGYAVSGDGRRLAVVSPRGSITVYSTIDLAQVAVIEVPVAGFARQVGMNHAGTVIAVTDAGDYEHDSTGVAIWSLQAAKPAEQFTGTLPLYPVFAVTVDEPGEVVTAFDDVGSTVRGSISGGRLNAKRLDAGTEFTGGYASTSILVSPSGDVACTSFVGDGPTTAVMRWYDLRRFTVIAEWSGEQADADRPYECRPERCPSADGGLALGKSESGCVTAMGAFVPEERTAGLSSTGGAALLHGNDLDLGLLGASSLWSMSGRSTTTVDVNGPAKSSDPVPYPHVVAVDGQLRYLSASGGQLKIWAIGRDIIIPDRSISVPLESEDEVIPVLTGHETGALRRSTDPTAIVTVNGLSMWSVPVDAASVAVIDDDVITYVAGGNFVVAAHDGPLARVQIPPQQSVSDPPRWHAALSADVVAIAVDSTITLIDMHTGRTLHELQVNATICQVALDAKAAYLVATTCDDSGHNGRLETWQLTDTSGPVDDAVLPYGEQSALSVASDATTAVAFNAGEVAIRKGGRWMQPAGLTVTPDAHNDWQSGRAWLSASGDLLVTRRDGFGIDLWSIQGSTVERIGVLSREEGSWDPHYVRFDGRTLTISLNPRSAPFRSPYAQRTRILTWRLDDKTALTSGCRFHTLFSDAVRGDLANAEVPCNRVTTPSRSAVDTTAGQGADLPSGTPASTPTS